MSNTHSIGERIAEKVKAKAKARGLDPAQQLQKFVQERLCVRLWAHEESRTLTLKGAAAIILLPSSSTSTAQPPTSMSTPTSASATRKYWRCSKRRSRSRMRTASPSRSTRPACSNTSMVKLAVLVHFTGTIGKSAISSYADVGIGGLQPVEVRELPVVTMVPGQTSATIRAQPWEYAIAEKLHAVVKHGANNTRMIDYRDLLILSRKGFDDEKVREAIAFTFAALDVELPETTPVGLTPAFAAAKQADWERYLHRNRVIGMPQDFGVVVEEVRKYLDPKMAPTHAAVYRYA